MIINNNSQFNIIPSHLGLKKYILYYNIVFPKKNTFVPQYTLMPNACGTLSLAFDGLSIMAELWGATTRPILLGVEPHRYRVLLLIQFSPYGLFQITHQSQSEFTDRRLALEAIDKELYDSLHQAFITSETVTNLVKACEHILYKRLEKPMVSDALLLATKEISDSHGQARVKEIALKSHYSERQLNRLFLSQIGINIKNYSRITRFNYVLDHIQKSPCFFAALSQEAGYFDQSHFDKDFKAISGVSPQEYVINMSNFYYDRTDISNKIASKEE